MDEGLRHFIEEVTGESHLRVEQNLGDGFVRLRSEEAERRQAKHDIRSSEDIVIEMLRNSRDAGAQRIFVATYKEGSVRNITVIDDGSGIPKGMFDRIFEARVTSKLDSMCVDLWGVHGRGMALYAIKTNADDARVLNSKVHGGSALSVSASTDRLGEKRDQSTLPVFSKDSCGLVTVRGPKNISRTILEFAYIERDSCAVYFGSVAEIAATLWCQAKSRLSPETIVFCENIEDLDICDRLAFASSPEELAKIAATLGLEMSTRTARRIMDGQIKPAQNSIDAIIDSQAMRSYRETICASGTDSSALSLDIDSASTSKIRISSEDLESFEAKLLSAYEVLAASYFLNADVTPEVKIKKDKLVITIPISNE